MADLTQLLQELLPSRLIWRSIDALAPSSCNLCPPDGAMLLTGQVTELPSSDPGMRLDVLDCGDDDCEATADVLDEHRDPEAMRIDAPPGLGET